MSDRPESYEAAVERLEEIIDRLDSGQAGLRETLELCKEGRELVQYCAAELDEVGEGLKELRLDDLAAKLEVGSEPSSSSAGPEQRPRSAGQPRQRDQSRSSGGATGKSPWPMRAIVAFSEERAAAISAAPSSVAAGSSGRSRNT
jgi:exodeoxyribonuclease VII small subunit